MPGRPSRIVLESQGRQVSTTQISLCEWRHLKTHAKSLSCRVYQSLCDLSFTGWVQPSAICTYQPPYDSDFVQHSLLSISNINRRCPAHRWPTCNLGSIWTQRDIRVTEVESIVEGRPLCHSEFIWNPQNFLTILATSISKSFPEIST